MKNNNRLVVAVSTFIAASSSSSAYLPLRAINHHHHHHRRRFHKTSSQLHDPLLPTTTSSSTTINNNTNNDDDDDTIIITESSSPRTLVQKGMQSFRNYDVPKSLAYFNAADSLTNGALKPYLWQRGITYYYLNEYKEGSNQFKLDVKYNPLDVEEIVWDIACLTRSVMSDDNYTSQQKNQAILPTDQMMALPKGKKDRRKIMSTVYSLFRNNENGITEYDLRMAGHESKNSSDEFYSLFYLGL